VTALSFNVILTASTTVNVTQMGIRMIDGSSLGGPMITFPKAALTSQFGTTLITAGTTAVFPLAPTFGCVVGPAAAVAVEIVFVDLTGATHSVTATTGL
jgi:hypothetical protein